MILQQLKSFHRTGEPATREFAALMASTFTHYGELRDLFFEHLPRHLHQSELVSLVNVELKARLFDQSFCEGIPDALKSLRRAIIRLEDLRAAQPEALPAVNDLERLTAVAERLEALYQKHWEYYRYQSRLGEEDIVAFLLEVDQIGYDWDTYHEATAAVARLLDALEGRDGPPDTTALQLSYHREQPHHFAVGSLKAVMDFLEAGYRFICAVHELDPAQQPLSLLQLDVAEPVVLRLAVPTAAEPAFRRFLQYLFLKDLFKRDALLRFVCEAVEKDAGERRLTANAIATHHKEVAAQLKQLPADGRFTISDRTFPDDEVRVMQEFVEFLESRDIDYEALVRTDKGKAGGRARGRRKSEKAAAPTPAQQETGNGAPAQQEPGNGAPTQAPQPAPAGSPPAKANAASAPAHREGTAYTHAERGDRDHIQVLTERNREA